MQKSKKKTERALRDKYKQRKCEMRREQTAITVNL